MGYSAPSMSKFTTQQLKAVSLVTLTFQTAAFVLMARRSRIPDKHGHLYRTSTAVFLMEFTKLVTSASVVAVRAYKGTRQSKMSYSAHLSGRNVVSGYQKDEKASSQESLSDVGYEELSGIHRAWKETKETIFDSSGLKLFYPASAYAMQNVLQLTAATYLREFVNYSFEFFFVLICFIMTQNRPSFKFSIKRNWSRQQFLRTSFSRKSLARFSGFLLSC